MHVKGVNEILDQLFLTIYSVFGWSERSASYAVRDHANFPFFPVLPQPMGHVEQNALEKQHERHPLVIRMVSHLVFFFHVTGYAWVSHVCTETFADFIGQRERMRYPAKRVDDVFGNSAVGYTRYRIA